MNIEIWGIYPPPIGGVTIHVFRLIHYLYDIDQTIILRNFGKSKASYNNIINVKSRVFEFIKLLFVKRRIIHIHSNNILIFFLFIILGYRHKIGITIHNKSLIQQKSLFKKLIIYKFFKKVDFIILNDFKYKLQLQNKFNISGNKMFIIPAFMPPLAIEWVGLEDNILKFREMHTFVISANAYKLRLDSSIDIYGFDLLIELVKRIKEKNLDVGLIFCLPMIGDKAYYNNCLQKIAELRLPENILIIQKEMPNGFEVWKISDLFIRPTYTDIEGISVKEALYCGTPVIASDACVRPDGVIVFKNRDIDDLFLKVLNFITNKFITYQSEKLSIENPIDAIINIYKSENKSIPDTLPQP
jgi:glycosyltransferase involved in cell wall biosynthesis